MPEVTPQRLALIAASITGVQTGAAIVGTRVVVDALGPATIGAARYAIALLLLLPIVLATGASLAVARRDRLSVVVLGVLQFGVQIVFINVGLQTVASAPAALLFSSFPLDRFAGGSKARARSPVQAQGRCRWIDDDRSGAGVRRGCTTAHRRWHRRRTGRVGGRLHGRHLQRVVPALPAALWRHAVGHLGDGRGSGGACSCRAAGAGVASFAGIAAEWLVGAAVHRCVERAGIRHLVVGSGAFERFA